MGVISDDSDVLGLIKNSLFLASGFCTQRAEDMRTDRIEYRISGGPPNGWMIFRQDMQIGIRRSIFDAVSFATHLAEREAVLGVALTKVAVDAPLARMHFA